MYCCAASHSLPSVAILGRISLFPYLFLQLVQLGGEVGHELHGGVEFVLQIADLVLLPFPFIADQRHGSHPGEPVQVLVLGMWEGQGELGRGVREEEERWGLTGSLPVLRD